jgi:hypothetical protein
MRENGLTDDQIQEALSAYSEEVASFLFNEEPIQENNTPEFNFAIMVPQDDYHSAINVLNRARIKPKTQFNVDNMSIMAFDSEQSGGDGIVEVNEDTIIQILQKAGIAAGSADGIEMQKLPMSGEDEIRESKRVNESSPLQAKQAKILIAKVQKITGWRHGEDVSDSASDLVRVEFVGMNNLDADEMIKIGKIDVSLRLYKTTTGWGISVPL